MEGQAVTRLPLHNNGRYRWENVATAVLQVYSELLGTLELLRTGTAR
jgi:hypothetical protein